MTRRSMLRLEKFDERINPSSGWGDFTSNLGELYNSAYAGDATGLNSAWNGMLSDYNDLQAYTTKAASDLTASLASYPQELWSTASTAVSNYVTEMQQSNYALLAYAVEAGTGAFALYGGIQTANPYLIGLGGAAMVHGFSNAYTSFTNGGLQNLWNGVSQDFFSSNDSGYDPSYAGSGYDSGYAGTDYSNNYEPIYTDYGSSNYGYDDYAYHG
jgi:hypothetical protein